MRLIQGGKQQKEKSAEDQPKDPEGRGASARRREGPRRFFAFRHVFVQIWVYLVTDEK